MMQMVGAFAEFERAMIRERTSVGWPPARAEGRIGGGLKKLDPVKRRGIAERVISCRKPVRDGAALYQRADRLRHRRRSPHRAGLACSFEQIVW